MFKFLFLVISSLFWFPILLFVLVCILTVAAITIFILLFGSLLVLLWLLKTIYRVRSGILSARQEIIKEVGQELNNISYWRFGRLTWKRYLKKYKEEKIERKNKENEQEIEEDYENEIDDC